MKLKQPHTPFARGTKHVTVATFRCAIIVIIIIILASVCVLYLHTNNSIEQYMLQSQTTSAQIINAIHGIERHVTNSLDIFSKRQIKWNDNVDLKINIIKNKVDSIEIEISESN